MPNVKVKLKNPPSGATHWFLSLYPWSDGGTNIATNELGLNDEAVLDVPTGWLWPLRFYLFIHRYVSGNLEILHQAQSVSSGLSYYVEEFIPEAGSYYYNVTTRKFEKITQAGISEFQTASFSKA